MSGESRPPANRTGQGIRSFALRQGRISKGQRNALERLEPLYGIPPSSEPIRLEDFFGERDVVLEIGFGMGLATAELAERRPDTGFLGVEVYPAGVGKLLSEVERRGLSNVRVIREDAKIVVAQMIPDGSLAGTHIFFPDPWPKKRHHKRRLVQRAFIDLIARKTKPGGYLYLVTDWVEYAEQMIEELEESAGFRNANEGYSKPLEWRPKTRFEEKGLREAHDIREIYAIRRPDYSSF